MKFVSTRNPDKNVNFEDAIFDCLSDDGGLYVPASTPDLRKWIMYTNSSTSFSSIAGALTSACFNDEFSPVICENIASRAFSFEPSVRKLDDNLYTLELFNTPTGSHKDFGVSYVINCLETILTIKNGNAVFLDATIGELGASVAKAIRGKKHVKAILVYPKGKVRGLEESDFVWNGGNIWPVEVDGTEEDCHKIVREIFSDKETVKKYGITLANTANIGRVMSQMFFYPFAFSRLKEQVYGDILYAMGCGNYSNVAAALYGWQFGLPVNGIICPATKELLSDGEGKCVVYSKDEDNACRTAADPASPSSLERLEDFHRKNGLLLNNIVYPSEVNENQKTDACKELYSKYGIFADQLTSSVYAAAKGRKELMEDEEETIVLVQRDDPYYDKEFVFANNGHYPELKKNVESALNAVELKRPYIKSADELKDIIGRLS